MVANDKPGALQHYEAELAIDEGLLATDSNNVVNQRAVAVDLSNIVPIVQENGDVARARELLTRCIDLFEQITRADPQNGSAKTDLSVAYSRMIAVMGKSGDLAGTRQFLDKTMGIYQAILEKDPANTFILLNVRGTYARMATALLDLNQPEEALAWSTKGVEIADRVISIAARPDTRRFKALSLVQRAKIHTLLAADANKVAAEPREHWKAARADYEETIKLLDSIPKESALLMDKPKRDEATAGLSKCDAALHDPPKNGP